MVQGHWGGDIGGMFLVLACMASFTGVLAPWWGQRTKALGDEGEAYMSLWGAVTMDSGVRAASDAADARLDWDANCNPPRGGAGNGAAQLEAGDCARIGATRAFALMGLISTLLAAVVVSLNKSSVDNTLSASTGLAGAGALSSLVAVAVAASMPLTRRQGLSGIGLAGTVLSACLATLAACIMALAKVRHRFKQLRGGAAGQPLEAEAQASHRPRLPSPRPMPPPVKSKVSFRSNESEAARSL